MRDKPPPLTHPALDQPGLRHGFFTRQGGVSRGIYQGLNCGIGSNDDPAYVLENRRRAANALGYAPDRLHGLYQHHSADCLVIDETSDASARPKADALATRTAGCALSILTADCTPVLLADTKAGVIGAAHAGWKGATGGVLQNTVATMVSLGASPANITAIVGPTISANAYEVGDDFVAAITAADENAPDFLVADANWSQPHFNLPAYAQHCLEEAAVGAVHHISPQCTYAHEDLFFSNRRRHHRDEPDYGRLISIIALAAIGT